MPAATTTTSSDREPSDEELITVGVSQVGTVEEATTTRIVT